MSEKRRIITLNNCGKIIQLNVEIADSWFKQIKGLMFQNSLAENEGMLFVFKDEKPRSLWMLFTNIPLEALFFDKEGKLIDIIKMELCNNLFCPKYKSKGAAKYILEVNNEFCKKNSVKVGCSFKLSNN